MARTIYDVGPRGSDWYVQRRGASRADSIHSHKDSAVTRGVQLARANQPSQLVIRRRDGTIEEERTYGDDPYPPPG